MTYRCVYTAPAYLYWANFSFNFRYFKWGTVGNYSYLIILKNLAISSKRMFLISEIWGLSGKVEKRLPLLFQIVVSKEENYFETLHLLQQTCRYPCTGEHLDSRRWDVITVGRSELFHMPNLIGQVL